MDGAILIEDMKTILLDIPLKRSHVMSFGSPREVNAVLVKLTTRNGMTGFGEAVTFQGPTWSEESSETIKAIIEKYIFPILEGKDLLQYNVLLNEIESRVKGNLFAKAAVECAILDIWGKYFGQPLYNLLGGKYRDKVPLSWSLASGNIGTDIEEAKKMMESGYKIFKVKAGANSIAEDIEKIKSLREELGPLVSLRLDANQGWNVVEALKAIKEMEPYGLEFIEQPLPRWNIDGLAEIRKKVTVPIMADESVCDTFSCMKVIMDRAADIFSFKLTKMGGLLKARNIYSMVEAAGLEAYIGCMIETSVGTAAYLQFAASVPSLPYGCELFGPLLLTDDIVDNPIIFKDGFVFIPNEPGMGVTINEVRVEKFKRKK
jgi:muconate/chloromuconate cycloisomerase